MSYTGRFAQLHTLLALGRLPTPGILREMVTLLEERLNAPDAADATRELANAIETLARSISVELEDLWEVAGHAETGDAMRIAFDEALAEWRESRVPPEEPAVPTDLRQVFLTRPLALFIDPANPVHDTMVVWRGVPQGYVKWVLVDLAVDKPEETHLAIAFASQLQDPANVDRDLHKEIADRIEDMRNTGVIAGYGE